MLRKNTYNVNDYLKEKLQFSDRLSELMFKRGKMNASQLGREVGLSHVTIRNYVLGQPPKSEHLIELAKFFGVTTDWLLGLTGEFTTPEFRAASQEAPPEYLVDELISEAREIGERVKQLEVKAEKLKPSSSRKTAADGASRIFQKAKQVAPGASAPPSPKETPSADAPQHPNPPTPAGRPQKKHSR